MDEWIVLYKGVSGKNAGVSMKYNLEAISKILEAPQKTSEEPLIAEEDENGVVTLRDKSGNIRYMMNRIDYDEILEWEKKLGKKDV